MTVARVPERKPQWRVVANTSVWKRDLYERGKLVELEFQYEVGVSIAPTVELALKDHRKHSRVDQSYGFYLEQQPYNDITEWLENLGVEFSE